MGEDGNEELKPVISPRKHSGRKRYNTFIKGPEEKIKRLQGEKVPATDSQMYKYMHDVDASMVTFLREHDPRFNEIEEEVRKSFIEEPQSIRITAEALAQYRSEIDTSLTFRNNKESFLRKGQMKVEDWRKSGKKAFVAVLDMDRLKDVNDEYDHIGGDLYLLTTSEAIKEILEGEDALDARYGGDEFALLLSGNREYVRSAIDKIRGRFNDYAATNFPDSDIEMGFSLGFTPVRDDENLITAVDRADSVINKVKDEKRKIEGTIRGGHVEDKYIE